MVAMSGALHNKSNQHEEYARGAVRYSLLVSKLKMALVGVALLLILLMVIWPHIDGGRSAFIVDFEEVTASSIDGRPRMEKPNMYGVDSKNQPFNISADYGMQEGEKQFFLSSVDGNIDMNNGRNLNIRSDSATYQSDSKYLQLKGNVVVLSDDGYEVSAPKADADLKKGEIKGQRGVIVQGPLGSLVADRFEMDTIGERMLFERNVEMRLYPAKGKDLPKL